MIKVQRGTDSKNRFGMEVTEIKPNDIMLMTGDGNFRRCKVALLIYNLTDPKTLNTLIEMTNKLYSANPEIYTILIGTHKDLERKIRKEEVEWFENFYFIDYSMEISTKEIGINECEAALKLSAALVYKTITESS